MYASATSGDKDNNDKFSPCSVRNMTLVIDAVVNEKNGKVQCFRQTNDPFCGNKIVEGDEHCDCGYDNADCGDVEIKCCVPRNTGNSGETGCRLNGQAMCRYGDLCVCFAPSERYFHCSIVAFYSTVYSFA